MIIVVLEMFEYLLMQVIHITSFFCLFLFFCFLFVYSPKWTSEIHCQLWQKEKTNTSAILVRIVLNYREQWGGMYNFKTLTLTICKYELFLHLLFFMFPRFYSLLCIVSSIVHLSSII